MKTLYTKLSLVLILFLISAAAFAQNVIVDTKKTYPGIKKIEVNSGWLTVTYEGGSGSDVNLEAYLESNDTDQDIVFVTIGDVLKITHSRKQNNYSWNSRNKGYIHISGPEVMALDLKGSSGNITVENVKNENTYLQVSSGNLTATNLEGNLTIKATSGNLDVRDIKGNVNAGITSGNANFTGIIGNLDYESTSGSLEADNVTGELNVSLTSGNAKLNNIGSLGFIKFTSGNIRANNAGLGQNTQLSGTSGNFNIQTPSNLKSYNFSLKASSGNLKVGGTNSGKTLEIDNGASSWVRGNISSGNITIVN
ncbi:DUF4097 family beta strand repeat-containing protein [Algoriphagus boritolerans]|uniref:Putative adhesin n=1 Tax=Algoriphagus boritolerans DSM 17298 = JCM 18970 TaxID=1120964 RepID=A0A1H6AGN1_9BACT|nr:DUF4097 family beta strand repeat-containing protein [Algoriphagus boritolerans]SEG46916.1 Putative adhesin [Algoriphagus boritolerans DSM 17298 = JCM 18970]